MSLKLKIFILIILLGIIPSIILGTNITRRSQHEIRDKVLGMSAVSGVQTVQAVNDRILYIEKALHTSVQNEDIIETLVSIDEYDPISRSFEETKLAKHFNAARYNNDYISSIILMPYNWEPQIYGDGSGSYNMPAYARYFLDGSFCDTDEYRYITGENNRMGWFLLKVLPYFIKKI